MKSIESLLLEIRESLEELLEIFRNVGNHLASITGSEDWFLELIFDKLLQELEEKDLK